MRMARIARLPPPPPVVLRRTRYLHGDRLVDVTQLLGVRGMVVVVRLAGDMRRCLKVRVAPKADGEDDDAPLLRLCRTALRLARGPGVGLAVGQQDQHRGVVW